MAFVPDGNVQKYRAIVQLEWSSEVFEGDPNDVFELADAEKLFLSSVLDSTALSLNPEDATFDIQSIEPILEP